jgi:hypothetical protein
MPAHKRLHFFRRPLRREREPLSQRWNDGYFSRMEVKRKRTVRLDQLIKRFGPPELVTLWTKPEDNPEFMRALKQHRVMTVIQQNVGTKKDYGLVGFFRKDLAAFWVFPRTLDLPDETKVIGIKYERLAPSEPRGNLYKPKAKNRKGCIRPERKETGPRLKRKRSDAKTKLLRR